MRGTVPTCDLVREAASARLDREPAGLTDTDIAQHLSRCPDCRSFLARVDILHSMTAGEQPPAQPPDRLLAAVAATRASPAAALVGHELVSRLRRTLRWRRMPAALAAMTIGVALPIASAGVFTHFDREVVHPPRCAKLLVGHVDRSRLP
jgi:predicted anti-sigma-YlaC factor YlaD